MKTLQSVVPTPEQLLIIQNTKPGISLIRGSAGSGKTTTALLRLRQLAGFWLSRRERQRIAGPVRILVVTFNRTLRGYIADLAEKQVASRTSLDLRISTFAKWSKRRLPDHKVVDEQRRRTKIMELGVGLGLASDFLCDEVDYALGRFLPHEIGNYLSCYREGRGTIPRVDRALRQRMLTQVLEPYSKWKTSNRIHDWNDLAVALSAGAAAEAYSVIVADEAQDLSANEIRALVHAAAIPSSITFVLDAAQRIYPRGFTWKEAGITILPADSYRLKNNHRNTREICRFALPLLQGMDVGDDGTFPDLRSCDRTGERPILIKGRYAAQAAFAIKYIQESVDLATESVAFLKPRGGKWFDELRRQLALKAFQFVSLTREEEWPKSGGNIALSTMYSAKGLEFDHVLVLGLNDEVTPVGVDEDDTSRSQMRRLLAMAITRARKTVVVGCKPEEASSLIKYFDPTTYDEVIL